MTEQRRNLTGMYRFTSIARPIDPAYLTNRALLIILPVAGLLGAGLAALFDTARSPLSMAFSGVLTAFAAWALTRELAPDYDGAAFVALAFAWAANLALGVRLVLLVFVALVLARIVNRSTGLPLRPLDTLGVLGFSIWAAMSMQQPLILVVASLAFLLDAKLEEPLHRHYLAAAACLAAFAWMVLDDGAHVVTGDLAALDWSLIGASAIFVFLFVRINSEPVSYCDTSPQRLDRARVGAGLVVGWLTGVQALLTNGGSAWLETPIWACMLALLVSLVARQVGRIRGRSLQ
jgi:hypothetical protein